MISYLKCLITKTRLLKYIENFITKNWKFSDKNSDIFHNSAQNIDCGYSLEPPHRGGSNEYPQSMFLKRNNKNNVYPFKPQFYYIKVGFDGSDYIGMFSWWSLYHTTNWPKLFRSPANIWDSRSDTVHSDMYVQYTQISLRLRPVWSESSLSAWRNLASLAIQNAPSEDSDQTARRIIFTFGIWHSLMASNICIFKSSIISIPCRVMISSPRITLHTNSRQYSPTSGLKYKGETYPRGKHIQRVKP